MKTFLSLGRQALANDFRRPSKDGDLVFETYPLAVAVCAECCHAQLTHVVDPERLFRDYVYRSGTSETLRTYFAQFVDFVETLAPDRGRVLDVGCNDGTQLLEFRKRGWACVGVDPCEEALAIARTGGIETHRGFWNEEIAEAVGPVDVILAQNVLAHTDDVEGFLRACGAVLRLGGRLVIQTSQARMIDEGQFDSIYHEHVSFFHTGSMLELAKRTGWMIEHATTTPIHGISYVWVLARENSVPVKASVGEMLAWEARRGLFDAATYARFAKRSEEAILKFRKTITDFRTEALGNPVLGYGAAAKGIVLLQAAGVSLDAIIDDCSTKWGTIAPGHVGSVVSPSYVSLLPHDRAVMWVVLAWNFFAEIFTKITRERVHGGDRVVTVFPKFQRMIVNPEHSRIEITPP